MLHRGLVPIPTEDLKKLLSLVHRGEVTCPLTPWEVARVGLQSHMEGLLGALRGLDDDVTPVEVVNGGVAPAPAPRAVCVAVLDALEVRVVGPRDAQRRARHGLARVREDVPADAHVDAVAAAAGGEERDEREDGGATHDRGARCCAPARSPTMRR